jgi:preflagellin peptidase FlaK
MLGSVPDLLRLVAVPVFGWAAYRDLQVRRVPNVAWYPLAALGAVLLVWESASHLPAGPADRLFFLRVGLSLGIVVPLAYGFWRVGGFGGADAKALMTLALLTPTYPVYYLSWTALPLVETTLGVFSLTVLTNTVIVGLAYPLALAVRNALAGDVSPAMFLARRVPVSTLGSTHGRLFEDRDGLTRSGLDVDALRMYLRWRGVDIGRLRADPASHRDPDSVGETYDPTDGAVDADPTHGGDGGAVSDGAEQSADGGPTDGTTRRREAPAAGSSSGADAAAGADRVGEPNPDPWAAERFLEDLDGGAYGTTPETLREGLETVVARDEVWLSPGLPFVVPMTVGLVLAFTYGDLLFGLLRALGAV